MNVPLFPAAIAHMDLPAELQLRRQAGQRHILRDDYWPRLRQAGVRAVIGAVFVHPAYLPEMALSLALEQAAALLEEIEESGGRFTLARTAGELDRAVETEQIAVLLSLEGCEPLGTSLPRLRIFWDLGVRFLGLTWNGRTMAADGCAVPGGGLTPFGRELAQAAWEQGMALDVSHLNDAGFDDLLALGGGPVFASHSNCRPLCSHPRNLTDGQLRRLGERDGVTGVNQIRFLARRPGSGGSLSDLCAHIRHMETVAGPGHACLGLDLARDYMAALAKPRAFWRDWDPSEEDILADYRDITALAALLLEQGMTEAAVAGVLGGNLLRFLRQALK